MEEKILELIKLAKKYEKKSKKNYIEIGYVGNETIEIHIRDKESFDFISSAEINLQNSMFQIDDVILKIKNLIKEEEENGRSN